MKAKIPEKISQEALFILNAVSAITKISPSTILNDKIRQREIAQARQVCHFFLKEYTTFSFARIGSEIGNKDHATVKYSHKTIQNLYNTKDITIVNIVDYVYDVLKPHFVGKILRIDFAVVKNKEMPPKSPNNIKYPLYKLTEVGDSFRALSYNDKDEYRRLVEAIRKYSRKHNKSFSVRTIGREVWVWRVK